MIQNLRVTEEQEVKSFSSTRSLRQPVLPIPRGSPVLLRIHWVTHVFPQEMNIATCSQTKSLLLDVMEYAGLGSPCARGRA